MKRFFIITLVLVMSVAIFSPDVSFSQRVVKKYNQAIMGNPLGFAFGFFPLTYEMQISAENSFTVGGVYYGYSGWNAFGLSASYRWYLFQEKAKAIKGISFGPMIAFGFWSYENKTYDNSMSVAIGGEIAYKFIVEGGFVIEPIVQINFNVKQFDGLTYRPFGIGVNLGYAW